jgi:xylulokinase
MARKISIGLDIGSSSVKAALLDLDTGEQIDSAYSPSVEMKINSSQNGWAEQNPDIWWENLVIATKKVLKNINQSSDEIVSIGISYQMHGLVMVNKKGEVIYPSIIWCDSRAVEIGDDAFKNIGEEYCLRNLLNSPGNFTASKLKWVKENKPEVYEQIYKIILPGDYIGFKLTNEIGSTISGLSEGIFWDFTKKDFSNAVMDYYGIEKDLLPKILPTFGEQGRVTKNAAAELGIKEGIPVTYRAGDQPNNAFSLNVLKNGEITTTAGTSGVVYGITNENIFDNYSRVNTFAHVNYEEVNPNLGVLLCINGTGILNSWIKNIFGNSISYEEMNLIAQEVNIGSDGLNILPFGNGAERVLKNKEIGCQISGLSFNTHSQAHIARAAQEGIAFSFNYGMNIMKEMGMQINSLKAGNANMFLSPLFCEVLSNVCSASIDIYNTDGAQGAARGAGIGVGKYSSFEDAFAGLKVVKTIEPEKSLSDRYKESYQGWENILEKAIG